MRFLKIFLGGLAVLFIGFLAIGLFKPTVNYTTEIETNKSIEESWAVFMDEDKMVDWLPGLQSMELIEGKRDEVGSKYKAVFKDGEHVMEMTETITTLEPNKAWGMELDGGMMVSNMMVTFENDGNGGTNIKSVTSSTGSNMFYRSLFAMMESHFAKSDEEIYGRLKTLIDENQTDYFPKETAELVTEPAESVE